MSSEKKADAIDEREAGTPPPGGGETRGGADPDRIQGAPVSVAANLPRGAGSDSAGAPDAPSARSPKKKRPQPKATAAGRNKGGQVSKLRKREKDIAVREFLAEEVKKHVDKILKVFLDATEAETTVYQAGKANVIPDHKTRITAASSLLAEAFGRPANVLVGKDGGPVEFSQVDVAGAKEMLAGRLDELAARRDRKAGG